jgi:hypothetical protein
MRPIPVAACCEPNLGMHAHSLLMVAAAGVLWLFVPVVLVVRWLSSSGRLGEPERRVSVTGYGPFLAAALSGGAAAVGLSLVADHAVRSSSDPNALAFVCSIGAGAVHFGTADTRIAGLLPIGITSLALVPAQAIWAVPRMWRDRRLGMIGLGIAGLTVIIGLIRAVIGQVGAVGVSASRLPAEPLADPSAYAVGFELLLLAVAYVLVVRPARVMDKLETAVADACVAIGVAASAVGVFAAVGIGLGHVH